MEVPGWSAIHYNDSGGNSWWYRVVQVEQMPNKSNNQSGTRYMEKHVHLVSFVFAPLGGEKDRI